MLVIVNVFAYIFVIIACVVEGERESCKVYPGPEGSSSTTAERGNCLVL